MQKNQAKTSLTALATLFLTSCTGGLSSQAGNNQTGYSGGQGPLAAQVGTGNRPVSSASSGRQGISQDQGADSMHGTDNSSMGGMKGMDHSSMAAEHEMDHSAHGAEGGHDASAAGKPGSASAAARTVNVVALDTMRFEPASLRVQAGETIRFVVTNKGKLPHEFVIGTAQEQKEHDEMMQKMPGMKHEDANAVSLAPGETRTLIWQFGQSNDVQIGCHIPGHYPAGMLSKVTVAPGDR